jgi:hypothetical protein
MACATTLSSWRSTSRRCHRASWLSASPTRKAIRFVSEGSVYRLLKAHDLIASAGDLAKWRGDRSIKHLRGAPYHPMTQGKIERYPRQNRALCNALQ